MVSIDNWGILQPIAKKINGSIIHNDEVLLALTLFFLLSRKNLNETYLIAQLKWDSSVVFSCRMKAVAQKALIMHVASKDRKIGRTVPLNPSLHKME